MTTVGFKKAENSQGESVECRAVCDVRKKIIFASDFNVQIQLFKSLFELLSCHWERLYLGRHTSHNFKVGESCR